MADRIDAVTTRRWIEAAARVLAEQRAYLTDLDAAIGDADHGVNMHRGFSAVTTALDDVAPDTVGALLVKAGTTLISSVGGASGPLYGGAFRAMGRTLDIPEATSQECAHALAAGLAAIQKLGAASPGDKTMIDAYAPALAAFQQRADAGADLAAAALAAADAAEDGMRATTPMQARKGRASYLGARSIGHPDPGAASTALIFRALAETAVAR
jgi:dihydroxyacetone kinase-like protein